jgi:predicted dienelactone hydrolase
VRLLEWGVVLALVLAVLGALAGRRWPWRVGRAWALVLVALVALQIGVEGARMPMAAAYGLALILVLGGLVGPRQPAKRPGWLGVGVRWALGIGLVAVAVLPPWLFPVFRLPAPSGPFAVGTLSFALTDSSRTETFGAAPGGPRAYAVRVWYPAPAGTDGPTAPYATAAELTGGILGLMPGGRIAGGQLAYVKTHSHPGAPVASAPDRFPVLVFSHGYTGFSAQNTPQMEELASRGYVVFSLSHTFDAGATVFPDGRVVPLDPVIVETFTHPDPARTDSTTRALAALAAATTPEARQAAFLGFSRFDPPRIVASVAVWSGDTRHLLDYLEGLASGQPGGTLSGRLDLDRIGIFGMSFGGSNTGEVCRVDPRCKAGINIDGEQFGSLAVDDSVTAPFMIIASNAAVPLHRVLFDHLRGPAYLVHLVGTQHVGLTDMGYVGPHLFRWLGLIGTMPVDRTETLLSRYVVAFFDRYLRGMPAPELSRPDGATDVEFEYRAPAAP